MTTKLEEYDGVLAIDKNDLDEELIRQSEIFNRISQDEIDAIDKRDQTKDTLGIVEADLDLKIREDFEKREKKSTETIILSKVTVHRKRIEAREHYRKACKRVNQLTALKDSFQQRSYMLNKLVDLFIAGYFIKSDAGSSHSGPRRSEARHRSNRAQIAAKRQTVKD